MKQNAPIIRPFKENDRNPVIALWQICGLTRPWNDPNKDIDRKIAHSPELFLVLKNNIAIIGTIMAGYDGHRGSIFYLAIAPEYQKQGFARLLMSAATAELTKIGCPKINLMVRQSNHIVCDFYRNIGYQTEEIIAFGKRLIED